MRTGSKGLALIKKYEGCRLTAYKCPAGVPTIGYGHTSGVKMGQTITQAQADTYLKADLVKFEKIVSNSLTKSVNQNQFDALVSFAYNIGNCKSIASLINSGKTQAAANKFIDFNKARVNGVLKELAGLTKRREEERKLFMTAVTGSNKTVSSKHDKVYYTIKKGDTLSKIASTYKTTATKIASLNTIKNPNKISVGQKIRVK